MTRFNFLSLLFLAQALEVTVDRRAAFRSEPQPKAEPPADLFAGLTVHDPGDHPAPGSYVPPEFKAQYEYCPALIKGLSISIMNKPDDPDAETVFDPVQLEFYRKIPDVVENNRLRITAKHPALNREFLLPNVLQAGESEHVQGSPHNEHKGSVEVVPGKKGMGVSLCPGEDEDEERMPEELDMCITFITGHSETAMTREIKDEMKVTANQFADCLKFFAKEDWAFTKEKCPGLPLKSAGTFGPELPPAN